MIRYTTPRPHRTVPSPVLIEDLMTIRAIGAVARIREANEYKQWKQDLAERFSELEMEAHIHLALVAVLLEDRQCEKTSIR